MANSILLPDGVKPTNLHYGDDVQLDSIESDVFGICERIKEVSPNLSVVLARRGDQWKYIIMERCEDGVERKVFQVGEGDDINALDGRVIAKLRKLQALPLKYRIAAFDREQAKAEARRREEDLDQLYEDMGAPMWGELERSGFIQRPVSYPKTGVTGGKGSASKA